MAADILFVGAGEDVMQFIDDLHQLGSKQEKFYLAFSLVTDEVTDVHSLSSEDPVSCATFINRYYTASTKVSVCDVDFHASVDVSEVLERLLSSGASTAHAVVVVTPVVIRDALPRFHACVRAMSECFAQADVKLVLDPLGVCSSSALESTCLSAGMEYVTCRNVEDDELAALSTAPVTTVENSAAGAGSATSDEDESSSTTFLGNRAIGRTLLALHSTVWPPHCALPPRPVPVATGQPGTVVNAQEAGPSIAASSAASATDSSVDLGGGLVDRDRNGNGSLRNGIDLGDASEDRGACSDGDDAEDDDVDFLGEIFAQAQFLRQAGESLPPEERRRRAEEVIMRIAGAWGAD